MRSCVRVGKGLCDAFEVMVSVHQGPMLSPLLFIIVFDALSLEKGRFHLPGSSFIVCLYKEKGHRGALDRGNYRGLKLTEQSIKVFERLPTASLDRW